MLHPLWATALSHSTGLTLGLTSTVELPLWAKKLETKRKRSDSPALEVSNSCQKKNKKFSTTNVCLVPKLVSLYKETISKMIVKDDKQLAK